MIYALKSHSSNNLKLNGAVFSKGGKSYEELKSELGDTTDIIKITVVGCNVVLLY